MTYIETPIPIECIDPHTLDKKMIVETMAEAIAKAFDGYLTYVKEVKEWYKFTQTANGLVGIPASSAEFIVETFAASKTIQASDSNKLLRSLSDVNVTVTIPKDITVKMPITIEQAGNGSVLIEAQTDVTINGTAYNTAGQYSFIQIVPVASNIYTIVGGGTTGGGYIHPTTHPASIIEETSEKRFVSDSEKTTWNGKAAGDHGHSEATTVNAGFMSAADKVRLDNMDDDANNYTHPNNHAPSIISQDANNRFVSDTEKATWNGKAAGTHSHSPANINQDANNRFVSDTEKATWNAKVDEGHRHNPSDIRTDELAGFVSNIEKAYWNSKAAGTHSHGNATTGADGYMSAADKAKLDGVAENANNYLKMPVLMATTANLVATYNNTTMRLTASANGAMASIDGIAPQLNARLLVKNQTTTLQNGIYKIIDLGSASTPYILERTFDCNSNLNLMSGIVVLVDQGTAAADSAWQMTTNSPIVIGTTAIVWAAITHHALTATAPITKTGGTIAHSTSDGSKHVPANSTTNDGKFLRASAVAGTYTWELLTEANIPALSPAKITQDTNNRFASDTEKANWNRAKVTPFQSLNPSSPGNVNIDCANGFNCHIFLAYSTAIIYLNNVICGDEGIIILKQDATGNRAASFGATLKKFQRGFEINLAPNGLTIIAWKYEQTITGGTFYFSSGIYE